MKKNLYRILFAVFALIFTVSCTFLIREIVIRHKAVSYMEALQSAYKPIVSKNAVNTDEKEHVGVSDNASADLGNPTVRGLTAKYQDVVGWLTADGAEISHPFVIGNDNSEYLRADLDGNYLISGSLFLDYRSSRDLADSVSVIYGHNMQDKTMFGKLSNYLDSNFLADNPDVYISLPDSTVHYTAFACMIADAADSPIYKSIGRQDNISDIVAYITRNADYLNNSIDVDGDSRLLVLSTCNPLYFTARTVLICVMDK